MDQLESGLAFNFPSTVLISTVFNRAHILLPRSSISLSTEMLLSALWRGGNLHHPLNASSALSTKVLATTRGPTL